MLNLKVEMSSEPVVEEAGFYVSCWDCLSRDPVVVLLLIDLHWNMRHLGNKREPETLQSPTRTKVTSLMTRKYVGVKWILSRMSASLPPWDTPRADNPPPPRADNPPRADTSQAHTPPWADTPQCMLGYGQQAGGMQPTGMHSCLFSLKTLFYILAYFIFQTFKHFSPLKSWTFSAPNIAKRRLCSNDFRKLIL